MSLNRMLASVGLCRLSEFQAFVSNCNELLSETRLKAERESYEVRRALGDILYALGSHILTGDCHIGALTQYEARIVMQAGSLLRSSWRKGLAISDERCQRAQLLAIEYGFDLSKIQQSGDALVNEFEYPELFSLGFDPQTHGPELLISFCETLVASGGRLTAQQSFDHVTLADNIQVCSA